MEIHAILVKITNEHKNMSDQTFARDLTDVFLGEGEKVGGG